MNDANENLKELHNIMNRLDSQESNLVVSQSKVSNPSNEVESALTTFVTTRLERLERDAQFGDLVKMHIRQRMPEFNVDQLLQLNEQVSRNNNKSVEALIPLFVGDTAGKTTVERLRDNNVDTAAKSLYDTADKEMLQAVSYLSSIMTRIAQNNSSNSTIVEEAEITN